MNKREILEDEPMALETHTMRLQTLVGELLLKNQKLREELDRLRRVDGDALD